MKDGANIQDINTIEDLSIELDGPGRPSYDTAYNNLALSIVIQAINDHGDDRYRAETERFFRGGWYTMLFDGLPGEDMIRALNRREAAKKRKIPIKFKAADGGDPDA